MHMLLHTLEPLSHLVDELTTSYKKEKQRPHVQHTLIYTKACWLKLKLDVNLKLYLTVNVQNWIRKGYFSIQSWASKQLATKALVS